MIFIANPKSPLKLNIEWLLPKIILAVIISQCLIFVTPSITILWLRALENKMWYSNKTLLILIKRFIATKTDMFLKKGFGYQNYDSAIISNPRRQYNDSNIFIHI